ncbi:23S rRNA (uracil(1939)-C(5))-methyltransferase RlmD [Saccharibacillus sp. O16]|nr:23S rRNA (uracil(1939)-C(5))-methyltransferase RlmD [Saccharibacillus sp. O16]
MAKEQKKKNRPSGKKKPGVKRSELPGRERTDAAPVERTEPPAAKREGQSASRSQRSESAGRGRSAASERGKKSTAAEERLSPSERYEKRQSERAKASTPRRASGKSEAKRGTSASRQPYAGSKEKTQRSTAEGQKEGRAQQRSASESAGKKPYAGANLAGKRPTASAPADAEQVKIGDRVVVTIKRIGINGEGVGYYRRKAIFIEGAITDEVVKAEVTEAQDKFLKAKLLEVEKKSPDRVVPPCPVFGLCGGCQLQHISYEGQLKAKWGIVREAFSRYAGLHDLKIKPTLGMDRPWDYRNKAQLQLERRDVRGGNSEIVAGLYEIGSHEIVDISGCPIQHPMVNRAIDRVKAVLAELDLPLAKGGSAAGGSRRGIRTVVVRHGFQSGELQVTLVTEVADLPRQTDLIERLRLELPEMTSLSLNINAARTPLVFGERTTNLWGAEAMKESLGDLEFELSPRAFFQLNPEQTVKLYETVRAAAALTGKETVVDAYCGTGTIGLWLAPHASEVRGIEVIPEAVEDAKRNAERSGRSNAQFFAGEAEELLPRWAKAGLTPDVIVADPPRTGLDRRFLDTVLRTKPKRFVYVSCNPSTLAKDCKVLLDGGYEIQSVQPIDMFPQTSQVECCTLLVRKDN